MNGSQIPDMEQLAEWRKRLGLSRERVTARLGMSSKTLQRWERDGRDPGEFSRRRLANAYADAEANPEEWAA